MTPLTIHLHGGSRRTVDRDWSSNVTNKHRGGSKLLLVVVDVYPLYVLLSHCAKLRPQQYSLRPSVKGDHEHTTCMSTACT